MPHWLIDLLDVEHADLGWQAPATLPTQHDLRDAIQRCNNTLDGQVTPAHARQCFAKLIMAFEPTSKLTGDETRLRMSVWLEACGDLNDALWTDATTQALQTLKWMPKPAEFRALVSGQIDVARRRMNRLVKMLDLVGRPVAKPFTREPEGVRLRAMVNSFRKVGDLSKAAQYERRLAAEENREPEAWATAEVAAPAPLPDAKAPPREPIPQGTEVKLGLLIARIEFFKDMGMVDYVAQMEAELAALQAEAA